MQATTGGHGPLNYLESFGAPAHEIRPILLALGWLSVAVVVIITALVLIAVLRRGRRVEDMNTDTGSVVAGRDTGALRWIYAGVAATVAILLVFVFWTVTTMAAIQTPRAAPAATVEVTGHQFWWQVAYKDADGATLFETANEIRVPVGKPVRFVLRSADVIHSFWVPLLGGKTDMIPGQENVAWLRADAAGVYRGQCVEYCGLQHAKMAFELRAVPPQDFDAWLKQRAEAAPSGPAEPSNNETR
ncbi:cytochrome c oxidase subunit II [Roseovarius spongiae]|nr:cytochrome c oxidase subunit II [Roseovarius spongiae]